MQKILMFSFFLLLGDQAYLITGVPSAHPYGASSNEDKVQYYKDQIEQKMLQNEVAKEMFRKPLPGDTSTDTPPSRRSCLNTDSASALNEWTLRELINSVSPGTFKDAVVNTYYALTDFGGTVDDDSDPLHVLWPSTEQAVRPSKIWLNYAPYANSSRYLMQIYENSVNKPTIEIAGMYSVESVDMTIERLQCLAKLVSSGFKLIVWDTDTFRSKLQEHCQVLITQASNSDAFGKRIEVLERLVEFVKELSNNPDIGKWCPTTASRRAKLQNLRMWRN